MGVIFLYFIGVLVFAWLATWRWHMVMTETKDLKWWIFFHWPLITMITYNEKNNLNIIRNEIRSASNDPDDLRITMSAFKTIKGYTIFLSLAWPIVILIHLVLMIVAIIFQGIPVFSKLFIKHLGYKAKE